MDARTHRKHYYQYIFPAIAHALVRLVTGNYKYDLWRVELVPRWEIEGSGTAMNRDHVFHTPQELVSFCQQKCPHSLQVGGVMVGRLGSSTSAGRESRLCDRGDISKGVANAYGPIVIDIDIDDYDRTGLCPCQGHKRLCQVCFSTQIKAARLVLDYWLRTVFGFEHILHVFSGQKGIHVWVCDERAFNMTNEQRKTFLGRIQQPMALDNHVEHICQQLLQPIWNACSNLLIKDHQPSNAVLMNWLYPRMDMAVGTAAFHLKKLPLLPHQTSLYLALPLPAVELDIPLDHLQINCANVAPEQVEQYVRYLEANL